MNVIDKRMKNKLICAVFVVSIIAGCIFLLFYSKKCYLYDLKINMLRQPYGVSKDEISFSWKIAGKEKGVEQESYRIMLANTIEQMEQGSYVYDTGWILDNENTYVQIEELDELLEDNSLYCWIVEVKTNLGDKYEVAEPQMFTTAIGNDWKSKKGIWDIADSDFAFFRSEVQIEKGCIEKMILSVTASSTENTRQYAYQLYLNGVEIGAGPVRTGDNTIIYNTYDVTEDLQNGKNVLGAICYSDIDKSFLCQCTIFYKDGTKKILANSGDDNNEWKVLSGDNIYRNEVNSIGTSYYYASAENIDGRIYPFGWNEVDYDDAQWDEPIYTDIFLDKELVPYPSENMKQWKTSPAKVVKKENHYFVDMGKEIVGGIAIDVSGVNNDTEITLRYGEELDDSGNVMFAMRTGNVYEEQWILPAGSNCRIENIGMKTFRYIEIYDCPIDLTKGSVEGLELRQSFDENVSSFASTNELLNRIYDMAKYTIKATNQNLYVDSQSRERAPYEGDAYINMLTSYSVSDDYTLARFSNEWLYKNRTWPQEYAFLSIMCAYEDYMYTGNVDSLETYYDCLLEKLPQYEMDDKYNLYALNIKENGVDTPLVDWPENHRDNYAYDEAIYNTVINAFAYGAYCDMANIARVLKKEEAEFLNAKAEVLKEGMITHLYNTEKGAFSDGLRYDGDLINHYSQHATAYALRFGVYEDEDMANAMIEFLEETGEVKMSVYGVQFLYDGLYQNDADELAMKWMLSDSECSWSTMLDEAGATIAAEAWSADHKDNMTYSHPWGAAAGNLIVRGMFGIRPTTAGFDTFEIRLQPGGIESANVKVPTVKGSIEVAYNLNKNGNVNNMDVIIPPNSKADVYIPFVTGMTLNGSDILKTDRDDFYVKVSLVSGEYNFVCDYK